MTHLLFLSPITRKRIKMGHDEEVSMFLGVNLWSREGNSQTGQRTRMLLLVVQGDYMCSATLT